MSASSAPTDRSLEGVVVSQFEPGESRRARASARRVLGPLGLYLAISTILFGIPVIAHPRGHIIAVDDLDPSVYIWFLAWWPHALLHGINPFVTHAILYPDGYNVTWAASLPLPSIVLAPITLTLGAAVSWNALALLSPALSAWTAYLLCRHVTRRLWPSLIGGYIFGFSPYMLAHLQASPNFALVALLPVFVLLVVKHVEGSLTSRRFVIAMTLTLTAQFLISTEVLATSTLFGAFALLGGFALLKEQRRPLVRTIGLLVLAYAATAVLVSPYLYYFLFGSHYPPPITFFGADVVSFVLPPSSLAFHLPGAVSPIGSNLEGYLGLPLLLLILLFCWQRRRSRAALLPVFCLLLAGIASLGGWGLDVRGHDVAIWMPWRLFWNLPVVHYAIPSRFGVFVVLPAALIVAMCLRDAGAPTLRGSRPRELAGWGLALLAVASILPDIGNHAWNTTLYKPAFFQNGAYRAYLHSGDHVMTIPVWGPSQRWIADAGFPFALTAGSGGQGLSPAYTRYSFWTALLNWTADAEAHYPTSPLPADSATQLRRFVRAMHVTAIVVEQRFPGPWPSLLATLGVQPVDTGGIVLYRLGRPLARRT